MTRSMIFFVIGCSLIITGLVMIMPIHAQQEDADYIGANECSSCHRDLARIHDDTLHALSLQDDEDAILANFETGEDVRQVQFPGEDAPRAFTQDDIEFIVGTGRHIQRYLYEVEDEGFRVLPAQWDVAAGEWRPLTLADSWDDPAYDWEQSCVGCHVTGYNPERERWEDDGVQCEACHGPGEAHADLAGDARNPDEEEIAEIRAAINPGIDPQVCGQCHGQGTLEDTDHFWSTGHANQKNMQHNEWLNSAHAGSLTSLQENAELVEESCFGCHSADTAYNARMTALIEAGNREGTAPAPVTLETAQFGVTCISCHDPHSENAELPANLVAEPYTLCTSCHTNTPILDRIHHPAQEMFEGVQLIEEVLAQPSAHFTAEDGPRCVTCHMTEVPVENAGQRINHDWSPVLPNNDAGIQDSCTTCHTNIVDAAGMQQLINDIQTGTQTRIESARAMVDNSTPPWIVQALDFVEGDGSLGIHNYPYTESLLKSVEVALGLAPLPLTEADVDALINAPSDAIAPQDTDPFASNEVGGGLTMPSIILLGIAGLIIATAAYAFFFRRAR